MLFRSRNVLNLEKIKETLEDNMPGTIIDVVLQYTICSIQYVIQYVTICNLTCYTVLTAYSIQLSLPELVLLEDRSNYNTEEEVCIGRAQDT